MTQPCVSVRYLLFKAFFISLVIHLIVLNVFIFTVPLSRETFKPAFIFLGPILKQQDVGDLSSPGERMGEGVSSSNNFSSGAQEDFFHSSENLGRRFIQGASREPVSPNSVMAREKVVMKSFFDLPEDAQQEQAESGAAPPEESHEIAPYKPLGLFSR